MRILKKKSIGNVIKIEKSNHFWEFGRKKNIYLLTRILMSLKLKATAIHDLCVLFLYFKYCFHVP